METKRNWTQICEKHKKNKVEGKHPKLLLIGSLMGILNGHANGVHLLTDVMVIMFHDSGDS